MSIVVTTPTGHIGSRVVDRLLAAGADVTVLARDPARLSDAVRDRATVRTGTLEDAAFVREATRGARALFLLVPPNYGTDDLAAFERGIGHAAADAVRANGIERVVVQSSIGAQRGDLFAVSALGEVEGLLRAAAPNVAAVRAAFFLENFLAAVPSVAAEGTIYMTLTPARRTAMVATRDIGDAAARLLLDDAWSGHLVRGVHGAADASAEEVTAAIGAALGRDVRYVQVPYAGLRAALVAGGASAHVADGYASLFRTLDEQDVSDEPRTAASTTETSVAAWARDVFAPAVAQAGLAAAPG